MTRLIRKKPKSSLVSTFIILGALLILLAIGALLVSVLIFGRSGGRAGNRLVNIRIEGERLVDSSEAVQYKFILINNEFSDLRSSEVKIDFPNGFVLTNTDQPCSERLLSGCTWSMGKIRRGEKKEILMTGQFLEASLREGDLKSFNGLVNFQLEDFSSTFQKSFQYSIFIRPTLMMDFSGSQKLAIGEQGSWQAILRNNSEQTVNRSRVIVRVPSGCVVSPIDLDEQLLVTQESEEVVWSINTINPREEKTISFAGSCLSHGSGLIKMHIETGLISPENKFFVQEIIEPEINLQKLEFNLSLVNNSNLSVFYPGDSINLTGQYYNNSFVLKDVVISLEISNGNLLDWNQMNRSSWSWQTNTSRLNSYIWNIRSQGDKRIIRWGPGQINAFKNLTVGDKGEINFELKVNDQTFFSGLDNTKSLELKLSAEGNSLDGNNPIILGEALLMINVLRP